MEGVKGFSKDMATSFGSGVRLEAGKTYKEKECKVFKNGWHFVEYAPDCLNYFPLGKGNHYFLIQAAGDINEEQGYRCCCTEITLVKELNLKAFAGMAIKYIIQNPKMDWEREHSHLQIRPEFARAQKMRSRLQEDGPKVYLEPGAIGGLILDRKEIIAARVFTTNKTGTYTILDNGEVAKL